MTRRTFLAAGAAATAAAQSTGGDIDLRALISDADLVYTKPVPRSEEGMPVGNGRMGSLVWTTPESLRLQINRVDVYANNSYTNSFFERHNDYCGGCGYVDIDFGKEVFPESGFAQRLSVYDGLLTVGDASILAWPMQDVMAVQVKAPVQVNLRMLRADSKYFGGQLENMVRDHVVTVQTRNHTAASRLEVRGECIVLTQEFREGDYCCKSAVAIGKGKGRILNETEVRLEVQPGTVLIASAATFDPKEDVAASALRQLEAAAAKGWAGLSKETGDWWHEFWSRGWVSLHSADGVAQRIAQNYHYFLYLMASTSRGKFPPKFNGMLWNTGGDLRTWGAQHWYANTSCYYEAIFASNRMELLDPFFDMYSGMFDASATAARQQWGSQGIYIGGDLLLQRSGETAGRHRGGNAGALPAAQALGAALGAFQGIRPQQASALQPLELDAGRRVEERPLRRSRSAASDRMARSIISSAARRRSRITSGGATNSRRMRPGCARAPTRC